MKKINVFILCVILIGIMLDLEPKEIFAKEKSYRKSSCKQIMELFTDNLATIKPEKFSYSWIAMPSTVTLRGPKYNPKTKNYDLNKCEYIKINANKTGTLLFSGDGEYVKEAPSNMRNTEYGIYLGSNPDFTSGESIKYIGKYVGGQYDEYFDAPQGFNSFTPVNNYTSYSIDLKAGDIVYIGCGQNTYNLRLCFILGINSMVCEEKGDSSGILANFGLHKSGADGTISGHFKEKEATIILKYGKNKDEYTRNIVGEVNPDYRYWDFNITPKNIDDYKTAKKVTFILKLDGKTKYSITKKMRKHDIFIKPPDTEYYKYNRINGTYSGGGYDAYAVGLSYIGGEKDAGSIIRITYKGNTYTTKSGYTKAGFYSIKRFNLELPVKITSNTKIKIEVIKDGSVKAVGIFRT